MAFGTRIKKVAFATATGIPQTYVERATGESVLYVPPQRDVEGTGFHMYLPPKTPAETIQPRMGFWSHELDRKNVPGLENNPPAGRSGWSWTLQPVPQVIAHIAPPPILVAGGPATPEASAAGAAAEAAGLRRGTPEWDAFIRQHKLSGLIGPDQFTGPPAPEVQRYDALPDTPPPGPAVPPQEPMLKAWWRQAQETFGPEPGPNFIPARGLPSAQPGAAPPVAAGFDIQKLILPVGLLAGAFLLMRAVR